MEKVDTLHAFGQLKILADFHRLEILRLLMAEPATLTQPGQSLQKKPGWVRHHIKTWVGMPPGRTYKSSRWMQI
ncbi:MAG: hypothetical protein EHM81_03315 [Chloroflexi bacterium]|nr:MAG: hypothetical protein EHM81_03315 [Chloroflexota bacterium]